MSLRNKILFTDKISNIRVIKAITQVADSENLKVFAVGGFVRDLILGREKNDLDVLVIGSGVDLSLIHISEPTRPY